MFLRIFDLAAAAGLVITCTIYAVKSLNFLPIAIPFTFIVLKIRFLDDGSNLWEKLLDAFNYLVNSQQIYFWGRRQ